MAYFETVVGDAGPGVVAGAPRPRTHRRRQHGALPPGPGHDTSCAARATATTTRTSAASGRQRPRTRDRSTVPFDGRGLGPWLAKLRRGSRQGVVAIDRRGGRASLVRRSNGRSRNGAVRRDPNRARHGSRARTCSERRGAGRPDLPSSRSSARSPSGPRPRPSTSSSTTAVSSVVAVERTGETVRIGARHGVLFAAGGFARNEEMRDAVQREAAERGASGRSANPGDTGEVIEMRSRSAPAVDLMDEAWWIPTSLKPDGIAADAHQRARQARLDHRRPRAVAVLQRGRVVHGGRTAMYVRDQDGGSIPSWSSWTGEHPHVATFGLRAAGRHARRSGSASGYMKQADTLDGLARQCGIDADGLSATVERFNRLRRGRDGPRLPSRRGRARPVPGRPDAQAERLGRPARQAAVLRRGDLSRRRRNVRRDAERRVLPSPRHGSPRSRGSTRRATAPRRSWGGRTRARGRASARASVFAYIGMKHAAHAAHPADDRQA